MAEKREIGSSSRSGIIALILFASLALKLVLVLTDSFPFNSDEAIVGLMARHILVGEFPVFFYGQAYMGSLDGLLVAAGFSLVGPHAIVIRMVQALLYLGTVFTTILIADRMYVSRKVGIAAAILLAIPVINTTLYTTVSLGGYGEALLLGNLLILTSLEIEKRDSSLKGYLIWGLLAGVSFWAFGLTLIYIIPSGLFILWIIRRTAIPVEALRRSGIALAGFIIGIAPILAWGVTNDWSLLLRELLGSAISGASASSPFVAVLERLRNLLLFGPTVIIGARPPWDVKPLATPFIPFILIFWGAVIVHTVRDLRRPEDGRPRKWMLLGVIVCLLGGFILSPFGNDPSGRYFLPLAVPMAILAGDLIVDLAESWSRRWAYALLVFVMAANLVGTIQTAVKNPPGITTQFDAIARIDHTYDGALIDFLQMHGERRGYTNYWVSYPLSFQSGEELIFIPVLPYHLDFRYTERDNRYAPYESLVAESARVAYITTLHPELDEVIRASFHALGVAWKEARIGDYQVFYDLSRVVRPDEIGGLPARDPASGS